MARTTPQVNKSTLTIRSGSGERHAAVGSAEWWSFLADETMTTFRFIGQQGRFTARRERKGGGTYWYAYRKLRGRLHKAYLGKDEELLVSHMETIARQLAQPNQQAPAASPLPGQFNGPDRRFVHQPEPPRPTYHMRPSYQDVQDGRDEWDPLSGMLLATKLFLPQPRPDLVARSRLLKRLDIGLHRKLTVVVAPAGFGKTTLLSAWLATFDLPRSDAASVAWLSLDKADNDPARFWAYVVATLKSCYAPVGDQVAPLLSLLAEPSLKRPTGEVRARAESPMEALITPLINILAALPRTVVLALDDYHLITAPSIHESVAFLLEHLPPRLHLVIASRREPSLPLSRLRAQGQLNELGANDLRFTLQEVTVFLNQIMGLSLTPDEIASLDTHTEGWIAALQLVALSMQGEGDATAIIRNFTGSHRYIMDYLTDEVLQRQPEYIRDFLLQTSLLDRLGEGLCNAVTGREDSQAILEYLEQGNLFLVRLDERRRWYRYHQLFAEFLQARLQQTHPEQVPQLHLRASLWCEQHGYITGAVNHAFAAHDMQRAAMMLEHFAQVMLMRGEITTLLQWANMLPRDVLFARPMLCIYVAGAYCSIGQLDTAEEFLPPAESVLEALKQQPAEDRQQAAIQQLEGELLTVRVALVAYRGDLPGAIELTQRAYVALPTENLFMRSTLIAALGSAYLLSGDLWRASEVFEEAIHASLEAHNLHAALASMAGQGFLQMGLGRLRQAEQTHRRVIQLSVGPGGRRFAVASMSYALIGELLAEWNELDEAERYTADGIELGKKWGYVGMIGESYTTLSYIHLARGDYDRALSLARQAEQQVRSYNMPFFTTLVVAFHAFAQLRAGNLEAAVQWADSCGLSAYDTFTYPREREHLFLVQICMAQRQFEQAQRILERLLPVAEEGGRMHTVIDCFIVQALLLQIQGQEHQALAALMRALALAEPEGYMRIFIDKTDLDRYVRRLEDAEGPLLLLLRRAAARGISLPYVRKLLAALGESAPDTTQPSGLLSERELMILHAIAAGKSNQEIAEELVVALSTVKTHLYNIYARLGVHSRTQAIARAKALHLIS